MAGCALASARFRDGALIQPQPQDDELLMIQPETFFAAAENTMPGDLIRATGLDHLKSCALLAITSIQLSDIPAMKKHVGHYFTILDVQQWHDEANWPRSLTDIDKEELRRVVRLCYSYTN